MKLSKLTISILQNLAQINNSIHIGEVFKLKSKTPNTSNIIAIATIEEELPELSIYSLDELLGSMSLFEPNKIDFTFTDNYIKMKEGKMKINYRLSDPAHILSKCKPAATYEAFNDFDCTFKLTVVQLNSIQKAARILKADVVYIEIKNGVGTINLINSQLPLDNSFSLKIDGDGSCEANIFVDNLIIMDSNYTVNVSSNKVLKFTSDDVPIFYYLSTAVL